MSELEDKLGAILSNQEAMSQIMALAQSLGGSSQEQPPPSSPAQEPPAQGSPDLFSALGNLDPRLISLAMNVAREYSSNNDDRAALLNALRPFVKPERYAKLDKAIQVSRLTRVIRAALDSFRKGEDSNV